MISHSWYGDVTCLLYPVTRTPKPGRQKQSSIDVLPALDVLSSRPPITSAARATSIAQAVCQRRARVGRHETRRAGGASRSLIAVVACAAREQTLRQTRQATADALALVDRGAAVGRPGVDRAGVAGASRGRERPAGVDVHVPACRPQLPQPRALWLKGMAPCEQRQSAMEELPGCECE
eukprot:765407-Hanusia_phi.AAC.8